MLTQATPAIVRALQGVLPPNALKQLTQALGNCNQPLTHRGDVNFQPNYAIGNSKGVYGAGGTAPWRPGDYQNILPPPGFAYRSGPGSSVSGSVNNYGGNAYDFSSRSQFDMRFFYGGNSVNVGGDINNTYSTGGGGGPGFFGGGGPGFFGGGVGRRPDQPRAPDNGLLGDGGFGGGGFGIGGGGFGFGGGGGGPVRLRTDTITVPQRLGIVGSIPVTTNAVSGVTVEYWRSKSGGAVEHDAISGGSVTFSEVTNAISSFSGEINIPAPTAIAVSYSKATGISGGTVSVPSNAISGGTVTYDKATGIAGSITYDRASGISGSVTIANLPTPSGTVTVSAGTPTSVKVVTEVTGSFDASSCTIKLTPSYATILTYSNWTATFTGNPLGSATATLSGGSVTHTPTAISLSSATITTSSAAASFTGTPAATTSASVAGLGITNTTSSATVTGGFKGGKFTVSGSGTPAQSVPTSRQISGVKATITVPAASESLDTAIVGLIPANTDQRAVVTGFAEQAPIVKTFFAP